MADTTTKHAGWMPGNPSMDVSGPLCPDFEGNRGEDGGEVSTHIMEGDYDNLWPGGSQGNLEPRSGGGVKGT